MKIDVKGGVINHAVVEEFNYSTATKNDIELLKDTIYRNKIAIIKNQALSPDQYIDMSRQFGVPEKYYQPMYHHPQIEEIFVSSNIPRDGEQVGVPRTGKFWHADYSFMNKPFSFTLIYPQVVPKKNRGTYFIDMGKVYDCLPDETKARLKGAKCIHSVRKYFKVRPTDVYRPISEVLKEIENETPQVIHPCVFEHPVTAEKILYLSDGFSQTIIDADGNDLGEEFLNDLLRFSGQLDNNFKNEFIHTQGFQKGDLLVWDNRSLAHCAMHTSQPEPTESLRITVHDDYDFYNGIIGENRVAV